MKILLTRVLFGGNKIFVVESGNSKWGKKGEIWNLFWFFAALLRMAGPAGLGDVEMSQNKEGNLLFIPKLGGF